MDQVCLGILGAARIVPWAVLAPAAVVPQVTIAAIAARDRQRAEAFAAKRHIPRVLDDYDAVLADPTIDAVYIPLPNSLHAPWALRALAAGKHVLCEKPFAANADDAARMAEAADRTGRVVMEAFHYRYHPLAARMVEIVASGVLGQVRHIEAWICFPLPSPRDIRYRYDLAGGATMDSGCYAIHLLRTLAGAEPVVTQAQARLASPQIDRAMTAEFRWADGRTGRMTCSLFSRDLLRLAVQVQGDRGELSVVNPTLPHLLFNRLTLRTAEGTRVEQLPRVPTYVYQLRAFARAILEGAPVLTSPADAVANMTVVDAVYKQAGLPLRGAEQAS